MTPAGIGASSIGMTAFMRFPIAADPHVLGTTAILFTRLIRLLRRLVCLNGSRLSASPRQSGLANRESEYGNHQHCP